MGKDKMPRTALGWLKVREIDAAPAEDFETVEDGNVVRLKQRETELFAAAREAQNKITHYTAELDRIYREIDKCCQAINCRLQTGDDQ